MQTAIRFILAFLVSGTMGFIAPAQADTTILLQLGSFPEKSKADAYWVQLVQLHSDMLETLDYHPASITLPPDNYTIHRVQAGPIQDKAKAQTICNELKTRSTDCFIVETAMYTPPNPASSYAEVPEMKRPSAPSQAASNAMADARQAAAAPQGVSDAMPLPWLKGQPTEPAAEQFAELDMPDMSGSYPSVARPASPVAQAAAAARPEITANNVALLEAIERPALPTAEPITADEPAVARLERNLTQEPQQTIALSSPTARAIRERMEAQPVSVPYALQPRADANAAQRRGEVQVGEAIPVPLSDAQQAVVADAAPASYRPRALGWGGMPSQSFNQQTYWAELNYFPGEGSAMRYWNQIRREMPPHLANGLRMRITKPYFQRQQTQKVSLRMGPFISIQDVQELCKRSRNQGLSCQVMRDLGNSSKGGQTSRAERSRDQAERQQRLNTDARPLHWIMLGSYPTPAEAERAWDQLFSSAPDQLRTMRPDIQMPNYSSSRKAEYRLRTGPFANALSAQDRCKQLQAANIGCLVVYTR